MLTITKYQCEICRAQYNQEHEARECELQETIPCPYKVGDTVLVKQRYDAPQKDVVQEVIIVPGLAMHDWDLLVVQKHQLGKDHWTDVIPRIYCKEKE